jgi:hypothetical protein
MNRPQIITLILLAIIASAIKGNIQWCKAVAKDRPILTVLIVLFLILVLIRIIY